MIIIIKCYIFTPQYKSDEDDTKVLPSRTNTLSSAEAMTESKD